MSSQPTTRPALNSPLWTPGDLDYLLSQSDSELESWTAELSSQERSELLQAMLDRTAAVQAESLKQPHSAEEEAPHEPDPARRMVRSKGDLAVALGMSLPMLDRYVKQGLPAHRAPYDVAACQEWLDQVRGPGQVAPDTNGPLRTKRLATEIAEREQSVRAKRLRNDILEGRLVYADEVFQQRAMEMLKIKQRLESLPDELQKLAPAEFRGQFRSDLAAAVHALLLEMSGWKLDLPGSRDGQPIE